MKIDTLQSGLFIDGKWCRSDGEIEVKNKYTGEVIAAVAQASEADVDRAVEAAIGAMKRISLSSYERYEILQKTAALLKEHHDEIALLIAKEGGKPLRDAKAEVSRAIQTVIVSSEEGKRVHGETLPLDAAPGSKNKVGLFIRVPVGVVAAIAPFNFPLNLVMHKVAPAIAAGCAVVLKPATYTPLTAIALCELMAEAGLPDGYLNLVIGSGRTVGELLVRHPKVNMVTFTGSPDVGERIRSQAGLKKVTLELGNNSANIVHSDADIPAAARALVDKAYSSAGQFCVSVQRVYAQEDIQQTLVDAMMEEIQRLRVGNPEDPDTVVGPLIDESEAVRVQSWVAEAEEQGAKVVTGGTRTRSILEPTLLMNTRPDMKVVRQEVFGPVASVVPYKTFEEAVDMANDSEYGLQTGVFTRDVNRAWYAIRNIQSGSVHINDTSSYRADLMPYGGVKRSGVGREGPRWAIEEMTEMRTVSFSL
ncbi:aldehyde dehydrogenase family protein [Alicyclobacillus sp. ALC3]|uniref:aldehyde dehydrogenase family protein n=1 Tax=Alicyclobacillus sp. ALC3 TaxID=2796143 RepID=UPI002377E292|nr:aldehyde dehydrogenase family protein [Alicyclobacillus sp. ALC3]WDL97581.1 aldehyde dehydrogenase family protein [Alicyclobacillus sp. ALC3]